MYEELINRLRCLAKVYSICENENTNEYRLAVQAADAIEELQKALDAVNDAHNEGYDVGYLAGRRDYEPEWIPVTERLPDNQCNVLCDDEGRVVVGYYTDEEVGWHDMHSYKIYPTHWMPLPQPPESEGE